MLRLTARAKINWTLDIVGTREDGYHLMDMLMSSVELADTLELEPAQTLSLAVSEHGGDVASTPADESNLVLKAARALQKATGCKKGASLRLIKRIPVGAGMGGGSADAAATLLGLCRLWDIELVPERLAEIALSIGADVPFLLTGGLARVRGIGEVIEPLPFPEPIWLVLIQPCEGLSTKEIFKAMDALPPEALIRPQTERAQQALLTGDVRGLTKAMGNVMEPVSLWKRPEMKEALHALEDHGALRAMMTGSGSAVYGLFEGEEEARRAYESLMIMWEKTYVAKTARECVSVKKN